MNAIRPWLYIGKYRDTLDAALLAAYGIGAMLQLAGPVLQAGVASLYLPIEDGEPLSAEQLRAGLDFVHEARQQGHTVLIACGAGISRSATFAIAALKEAEGLGLLDAAHAVRQCHSDTMPHMAYGSRSASIMLRRLLS